MTSGRNSVIDQPIAYDFGGHSSGEVYQHGDLPRPCSIIGDIDDQALAACFD
jgi:hypothetical protein